jgi:adenylylsulfate kinase-like enzyme
MAVPKTHVAEDAHSNDDRDFQVVEERVIGTVTNKPGSGKTTVDAAFTLIARSVYASMFPVDGDVRHYSFPAGHGVRCRVTVALVEETR